MDLRGWKRGEEGQEMHRKPEPQRTDCTVDSLIEATESVEGELRVLESKTL
jgi:hypothetical protein